MTDARKKIILVDDDLGIQDIMTLVLKPDLYDLTVLRSGEEILNADYQLPDLFILDKQLAGMDGLQLCRVLKSQAHTKQIPVIMLSAAPAIAQMAQEAGADGWIEKPFKIKDLRALTEKLLG